MKNLLLALFIVTCTLLSSSKILQANISEANIGLEVCLLKSNQQIETHTYRIVCGGETCWVFEYDEDGELVNIYPIDD